MQHCNIFVYHHKNVVTLSNCYAFQLHKHMQLYHCIRQVVALINILRITLDKMTIVTQIINTLLCGSL